MKKRIIQIGVYAVLLFVAFVFIRTLMRDWENVRESILNISWYAWLSIPFLVSAVVVSGLLWGRLVLLATGYKVPLKDAVRVHSASWILKYVPGQVGSLVNKVAWAGKVGISRAAAATSVMYENILLVFASVLVSIPVILIADEAFYGNSTVLMGLALIIAIVFFSNDKILYRLLNYALKLVKKKPIDRKFMMKSGSLMKFTLLYSIPRILNGIAFVIICSAMFDVTSDMYLPLAATFVFASVIGLLALFVPSGIGVREAVIVVLLSVYIPVELAMVVALVARFFATMADLGVLGVYLILNKGRVIQQ